MISDNYALPPHLKKINFVLKQDVISHCATILPTGSIIKLQELKMIRDPKLLTAQDSFAFSESQIDKYKWLFQCVDRRTGKSFRVTLDEGEEIDDVLGVPTGTASILFGGDDV